jgi:hypothetical protein
MSMMRIQGVLVYGLLVLLVLSCGDKASTNSEENDIIEAVGEKSMVDANNTVKVVRCTKQPFARRQLMTGVLKADQKASITFEITGVINSLKLRTRLQKRKEILAFQHDYFRMNEGVCD